jgi:hypothetical protein
MVNRIVEKAKKLTWFLHSGVYPENAPKKYITDLEKINHLASKKFSMTLIAIAIIALMYFSSVFLLFFFPNDPHVTALVSMYKDMIVAVAAIAGTLVGIQGLVDWKHNSSTDIDLKSETINQYREEKLTNNAKEEDYTTTV